jgi:hypothetical protein
MSRDAGPSRDAVVRGDWTLVLALARADGRKLLVSIWFAVGVAVAALGSTLFVRSALTDATVTWHDDAWTVHAGFLLLAVFAMVAANAAVLRDRREAMVEQMSALPTDRSSRVTGLTAAMLWPAAVSTALLGAVAAFAAARMGLPTHTVPYLLHNATLVVLLGSVGVALGVWVETPFAAPVLALGLYLVHPGESPAAWQVLWPFASPAAAWLEAWHAGYLVGVTLLLVAISQLRWGQCRRHGWLLLAGSVLTVTAVWVLLMQVCPAAGACDF